MKVLDMTGDCPKKTVGKREKQGTFKKDFLGGINPVHKSFL